MVMGSRKVEEELQLALDFSATLAEDLASNNKFKFIKFTIPRPTPAKNLVNALL